MLRTARAMHGRLHWLLAENVPGLGDHGVDRVCDDLEREDFTVWPFDLDTAPPGRHRGRRRFIIVAHANGQGQPRRAFDAQVAGLSQVSGCRWPIDAPPLGMDDGLPGRMDALRQVGNSISPWVAEQFGRAILSADAP
jgi:site-specific DNA-cytosine methylase